MNNTRKIINTRFIGWTLFLVLTFSFAGVVLGFESMVIVGISMILATLFARLK